MSGKNTDISAGQSFTVAASESVSLFAQTAGMKMYAGAGAVDIQAQADAMNVSALQDITITSGQGSIQVNASQELVLSCGGAYIKLSGGNIELGCPGNILLKSANVSQTGPASLDTPPVTFPKGYSGTFTVKDMETGEIKPFTKYVVTSAEGDIFEGMTDASGKTVQLNSSMPGKMKIEFPDMLSDEQFRVIDKSTGTPVSGYAYFIIAESGESVSGYTDNNGETQRIETKEESSVEVFWGEDALERMSRS